MAKKFYTDGRGERLKRLDGTVLKCVNVRRDDKEPNVWRPAGMPAVIRADGWRPLTKLGLPGSICDGKEGEALFWRKGHSLGVSIGPRGEVATGAAVSVLTDSLAAEVLSASIVEPGVIRMLLKHSRPVYLTYATNGAMTFHGSMPDLPTAAFTVIDETTLSEPLPNISLTGQNSGRNGAMCAEDRRRVTGALLDAYERLLQKAEATGLLLQPVFARYRLEDGGGDTVCCSATVMASGTTGFQCCDSIAMTSTDGLSTLTGGALTARGYRLRLLAPEKLGEPWRTIIRRMSIELTPQIDPVDRAALCTAAVGNDGNTTTVTLHLPGIGAASAYASAQRRLLVRKALESINGSFRIHDTCQSPFGPAMSDFTLVVRKEATSSAAVAAGMQRDRISYGACCQTPRFTVVSDERREGFKGHDAQEFMLSASDSSGAWCAEVKVQLTRGNGVTETAMTFRDGNGRCPRLLSPLLIYPDADAREMTITISSPDGMRTGTFALTPAPALGIAYFLASGLRPMELPSSAESISRQTRTPAATVKEGQVTIFRRNRESTPTDRFECDNGAINAIMKAPRNRSSWDHAREKVMLYGAGGTHVLAIDSNGQMHSLSPLDRRSILSAKSVTEATGKRGLSHLAIAGGDLVEIDQSGATTLLRDCQAEQAARCNRHNEIWLAGGGGPLRRLTSAGDIIEAWLDGAATEAQLHSGGGMLTVSCGNTLYSPGDEEWPEGGTEWQIHERYASVTPPETELRLFATECAGTVTISGDNGSRVAEKLVEIELDGAVNSPVYVPFPGPHRRFIECSVHVTTGADGEWRGLYG